MPEVRAGSRYAATRLAPLTTLRFFAASLIVLSHSGWFALRPDTWLSVPFDNAVSFFFVLSGFILTYTYEDTIQVLGARKFWLLRIARIWPAHAVTFLLVILLLPASQWQSRIGLDGVIAIANLTLLHAWIPLSDVYFSFDVVSWSISTEFSFYVLFPFLVRDWRATYKIKLLAAGLVTLGLIELSNVIGLTDSPAELGVTAHGLLYVNPLARMFEFVLGMALIIPYRHWAPRVARMSVARATALECGVAAFAVASLVGSRDWLVAARQISLIGVGGSTWLGHGGAALPATLCAILVFAFGRGVLSRGLAVPFGVLLGEISYAMYLVHTDLFRSYGMRLSEANPLPPALTYALAWGAVLLVSYAMWRWIETPARRWAASKWKTSARAELRSRVAVLHPDGRSAPAALPGR